MASSLRQRVTTGLPMAAAVIVILLWLPPWVAVATIMLVVAAGAWEWAGFVGMASTWARLLYAGVMLTVIAIAWRLTPSTPALMLFLACTAGWWLAATAWLTLATGQGGPRAIAAAGFAVLVPAALGLGKLVQLEPHGQALLMFLIVLIAAADIGAYFGGRTFGRRKLAPRVSPNKTWAGFWSGMVAAGCAAVAGGWLFDKSLPTWVAMCLVVALVSVVGDLVESMFKRRAGLKDSSGLLPGHGGVLDRLDSLSAAGPVFLLGLLLVGVPG